VITMSYTFEAEIKDFIRREREAHWKSFQNGPSEDQIEAAARGDDDEGDVDEAELERLLLPQAPAGGGFMFSYTQVSKPAEVEYKISQRGDGFMLAKGLQVGVKTNLADDKVLLIANIPATSSMQHAGHSWALKRGRHRIGPQFKTWTQALLLKENVLMPWLDDPGAGVRARLDVEYSVHVRLKAAVQMSKEGERRQLSAVVVPASQVTVARSRAPQTVETGQWYPVGGLAQVAHTNAREKVLVICTVNYKPMWTDEYSRGRLTIVRDGQGLDPEGYGLQSLRSTYGSGAGLTLTRTLVMAMVDDPPAGPHLYAVKACVTTGAAEDTSVLSLESDEETFSRQLVLLRLPEDLVVGPCRCEGLTTVEEDRWTEITGLSVAVTVKNSFDKALIVYHTNFNPTGMSYEVYFTLFRTGVNRVSTNMGHEDTGMCSVASSYRQSSEYPHTMFVDAPGAGTHTYSVLARTRRCDTLLEAPPVEIGPDGQIAAVLLERCDQLARR